MANSADPDQLASSEANWSGATLLQNRVYPGSAGQELINWMKYGINTIINVASDSL